MESNASTTLRLSNPNGRDPYDGTTDTELESSDTQMDVTPRGVPKNKQQNRKKRVVNSAVSRKARTEQIFEVLAADLKRRGTPVDTDGMVALESKQMAQLAN